VPIYGESIGEKNSPGIRWVEKTNFETFSPERLRGLDWHKKGSTAKHKQTEGE